MDDLDLNIHNYDLNDLLNLFKLPYHFTEEHLRDAKKTVLKTHPDKSRLDRKYFLFFSKAYKYLLKIYQLRKSSNTTNTEYIKDDLWNTEHTVLIDGAIKTMNQTQYNNWFNDMFEKMKIKDDPDDTGYGNWLKSEEGIVTEKINNMGQMNEYIQNKKKELRTLVKHNDFSDSNHGNHFDLVRDAPESYGSSMFDKLQYEDLKKAHSESVIPVTEEDYHNRKKYTSIDHINRDRTQDIINNDPHLQSHTQLMSEKQLNDDNISIQRAYKLMNQDEKIRQNYNTFWSDLRRIKNS